MSSFPAEGAVKVSVQGAVATVLMDRPDVHNAFDDRLIAELTAVFGRLGADPAARVIVLAASGRSFSAGADLNWMKRMAAYSGDENVADARGLAGLMRTIERLPKPVIARVQGAAFGGGVGLVACCDIAVAAREAVFCLSEVRLGLIPAVISPYVVRAIGARAARRYFLTAERFGAEEACRLGLVHQVTDAAALDAAVSALCAQLLKGGPVALGSAKDLIFAVSDRPVDNAVVEDTARRIAAQRAGAEGREGVAAFLEKRPPSWTA
jgi:methylglutaconyl-CoA hydratase